jgi:molecular chaperone DnaK
MRDEAKANEQKDKEEREKIDKLNAADAQVFTSEKNLKDYGDKIPADKKSAIEQATAKLKEAHKAGNIAELQKLEDDLNNAWHAASEDMAKAAGAANGGAQGGPNPGAGFNGGANAGGGFSGGATGTGSTGSTGSNNGSKDGEVKDVDFEEVK